MAAMTLMRLSGNVCKDTGAQIQVQGAGGAGGVVEANRRGM
jgi:hypothetical protein